MYLFISGDAMYRWCNWNNIFFGQRCCCSTVCGRLCRDCGWFSNRRKCYASLTFLVWLQLWILNCRDTVIHSLEWRSMTSEWLGSYLLFCYLGLLSLVSIGKRRYYNVVILLNASYIVSLQYVIKIVMVVAFSAGSTCVVDNSACCHSRFLDWHIHSSWWNVRRSWSWIYRI